MEEIFTVFWVIMGLLLLMLLLAALWLLLLLAKSLRLTEAVDNMRTLSRLESGRQDAALGPVLAAKALRDCLNRMNGLAHQRGISLILDPFEQSIMVYGKEELLGKVLENLLADAICHARTTVTISVKAEKKQVSISVSDDGGRIDEKDLPYLLEGRSMDRSGSLGIGFAIARTAAEKMEGRLEAADQHKGKAAFTLLLKMVSY